MSKIGLLWRTIRYLKTRQIIYQVRNRLRNHQALRWQNRMVATYFLTVPEADKPVRRKGNDFTFLNQIVSFESQVDWNYSENGKLWTYNLTYFDFLNQPNMTSDEGIKLIYDFIAQTSALRDALDPYPTSLRIGNWVQFLSRHRIQNAQINAHLFAQVQLLSRRLEYHLGGNHLLENGFALLMGALYFRQESWFRKAVKLIQIELSTQILADGCHDERSPIYHQLLLDRLLTVLFALQHDTWQVDPLLITFLTQKASLMLDWLTTITFHNGDVPMVNDAALDCAPTTAQLRLKADRLLTSPAHTEEKRSGNRRSGYRMFRQQRYELFIDTGAVGPNHQPGHAHADTFSFVLYVDNCPVLVDSGTSTYQRGKRRSCERSTAAHNTVEVANTDSSEVWAGFRVGRRARVLVMRNTETVLTARHNGYKSLGVIHQRSWSAESTQLTIVDRLVHVDRETPSEKVGIARFHFHPGITVQAVNDTVLAGPVKLIFNSVTKLGLSVTTYQMAQGFNQLRPGQCLVIKFLNTLETTITYINENPLPDLLL